MEMKRKIWLSEVEWHTLEQKHYLINKNQSLQSQKNTAAYGPDYGVPCGPDYVSNIDESKLKSN